MARLRLELDDETFKMLLETALAERRPVALQAEVLLRKALGLIFPYPSRTHNQEILARDEGARQDSGECDSEAVQY